MQHVWLLINRNLTSLFHYGLEYKYVKQIVFLDSSSAYNTMHGQDSPLKFELIRVNSKFPLIYSKIYCDKLELKINHNWGHAILLNLNTTIMNSIFAYKLFHKIYIYIFSKSVGHISQVIFHRKYFTAPEFLLIVQKSARRKNFIIVSKETFSCRIADIETFKRLKSLIFKTTQKRYINEYQDQKYVRDSFPIF